jgi:hypothetical protein
MSVVAPIVESIRNLILSIDAESQIPTTATILINNKSYCLIQLWHEIWLHSSYKTDLVPILDLSLEETCWLKQTHLLQLVLGDRVHQQKDSFSIGKDRSITNTLFGF